MSDTPETPAATKSQGSDRPRRADKGIPWRASCPGVALMAFTIAAICIGIANAQAPAAPDLPEMLRAGRTSLDGGDWQRAQTLGQNALALAEREHGASGSPTAQALMLLARAQAQLGQHDLALASLQRALAIRESLPDPDPAGLADSLRLLGLSHSAMARYGLALQHLQRALDVDKEVPGTDRPATAVLLGQLSAVRVKLGQYDQALALSRLALASSEKSFGREHPATATALEGLVSAQLELAQYRPALENSQRAVAIREASQGPSHADLALSLNQLGVVHNLMGQYAQALALQLRALPMAEQHIGPDHPDTATVLSDLGQTHKAMGQLDKALPLQQRALAIRSKAQGPDHPNTASTMIDVAMIYTRIGQYETALPLQLRALAIDEKVLGPEHPVTSQALNNLGFIYTRLGQHDLAVQAREKALVINEKVYGPEHPETAYSLANLATNYEGLGQHDKTLALRLRALAIREKALGPEHSLTAGVLNNVANSHFNLAQFDQALPYLIRALAIREKALGPEHPDTYVIVNNLGSTYRLLGRYEEARPLQQRAFMAYLRAFGPDHPTTAKILSGLAYSHQGLGDQALAIAMLKQTVNAYQAMREQAARMGSAELQSYTASVSYAYQDLAAALTEQGRLPEAQMVLDMLKEDEQFDFIRRSPSADPRRTRIGYTPAEQDWTARYRKIAGQLAALGVEELTLKKQAAKGLNAEQKQRQQALAADLAVAQSAFADFLSHMREDFARKGLAREVELAESSVKALGELRGLLRGLGDGAVLLQIYLTDDKVNLLLTSPGVQLARSSPVGAKALNRQIAEYRRLLRDPKSDPLPAAQALYQLLIAPVAQDLAQAGAKTVMLSLDGVLRYLPFGALHDGQRYLAQRWALPLYTSVTRDRLRDAVAPQWQAAGLGLTRKLGEFDPLPGVQAEMDGIIRSARSASAAGALPGEVHLDEAFTAQRLKDVSQRHFSVLHIASHFRFSPGTEANSFLLLGDGQQLTLGELRTQNYRFDQVDLLTLSACDTGLGGGRDERGREIEGFGVIAQQQGAKAVLATLWPVADQSTAQLMADLYRRRQEQRLSKVEALRQAQLALQAQPRTSHPFYWAPFILMGNWK